MAKNARAPLVGFKGLNNVTDPLRLPPAWQTQADNVDITAQGVIQRARGFAHATTNFAITGAYATEDFARLYVVDQGELRQYDANLGYVVRKSGLASDPMHFAEIAGQVFYANGSDYGVIAPDGGVRAWGIAPPGAALARLATGVLRAGVYRITCTLTDATGLESGNGDVVSIAVPDDAQIQLHVPQVAGFATSVYVTQCDGTVFFLLAANAGADVSYNCTPDALGTELRFWLKDPPRGSMPAPFAGRMYLAEAYPQHDLTMLWPSQPLQYHHFDYSSDGIAIPGTVLMPRACDSALIVGTERALWAWDGTRLTQLADYGVVPGFHASRVGPDLYFWTTRGLCKALPFVNLTEHQISVAPGVAAGATVMERDGQRRYLVALQKGGSAFNARN